MNILKTVNCCLILVNQRQLEHVLTCIDARFRQAACVFCKRPIHLDFGYQFRTERTVILYDLDLELCASWWCTT